MYILQTRGFILKMEMTTQEIGGVGKDAETSET